MPLAKGQPARHMTHGTGEVVADLGEICVVRFETGLLEVATQDLAILEKPQQRLARGTYDAPLATLLRVQAEAIRSTNNRWGVFARSRVALLPHQLWVCRKVLQSWPFRWLVADDVGLGKTIEAALILTPLLSSGRVRRLLVLAPAGLVEQWQLRLRQMFDIRLVQYLQEADTAAADFWNTHHQVVASAETVRLDRHDRWERLRQADPWDLLIVDEAHHLNADERAGPTLAYKLVRELEDKRRVKSMLFFTGTPHRGKDFGFLSLLRLLRSDLFDTKEPLVPQLRHLREVMIRNNKQRVTTMTGKPLFTSVTIHRETHGYTPAEAEFYAKLTEFIASGKAFASTLDPSQQRTVILVLITMQKLASSSVAAVRRALRSRLARLRKAQEESAHVVEGQGRLIREVEEIDKRGDPVDQDRRSTLEELLLAIAGTIQLNPEEIPALEELIRLADAVGPETKIERILDLVAERFGDRSVLLFTEYKATQSLVYQRLREVYGADSVTFINGEGVLEPIHAVPGLPGRIELRRSEAAAHFNAGKVRFLVSTEAAGEGIDLHYSCSSLIHVDLPWNPMRLHQRVGRLSRYGQQRPVEVVTLHNPGTVEGRIWELLNEKLERITKAFQSGMDDPEDMLQAVLGMTSSSEFDRLFADAERHRDKLTEWFDAEAATFGGEEVVSLVKRMFGSVARFDFGAVKGELPRVDLPDLLPFLRGALVYRNRRVDEDDAQGLAFLTPDMWREREPLLPERFTLRFDRNPRDASLKEVAGIGHRLVDCALEDARALEDSVARLPRIEEPIVVFRVRDAISQTDPGIQAASILVGVQGEGPTARALQDWQLLSVLNESLERPHMLQRPPSGQAEAGPAAVPDVPAVQEWLTPRLGEIGIDFEKPEFAVLAVLLPEMAPARRVVEVAARDLVKTGQDLSRPQEGSALDEIGRHTSNEKAVSVAGRLLEQLRQSSKDGVGFEDVLAAAREVGAEPSDGLLAIERLALTGAVHRVFLDLGREPPKRMSWEEVLARLGGAEGLASEDWRRGARTMRVRWQTSRTEGDPSESA